MLYGAQRLSGHGELKLPVPGHHRGGQADFLAVDHLGVPLDPQVVQGQAEPVCLQVIGGQIEPQQEGHAVVRGVLVLQKAHLMQAAAELSAGLPSGVQGGQLPVEIVVLRPQNGPLRGGQLTQQDHIIAVGEHLGDMDGRPVLRRGGQVRLSKAGGQKFLILGRSPQKGQDSLVQSGDHRKGAGHQQNRGGGRHGDGFFHPLHRSSLPFRMQEARPYSLLLFLSGGKLVKGTVQFTELHTLPPPIAISVSSGPGTARPGRWPAPGPSVLQSPGWNTPGSSGDTGPAGTSRAAPR